MIAWLIDILIGNICFHRWTVDREVPLMDDFNSTGKRFYLSCTKCGIVKKKDLI